MIISRFPQYFWLPSLFYIHAAPLCSQTLSTWICVNLLMWHVNTFMSQNTASFCIPMELLNVYLPEKKKEKEPTIFTIPGNKMKKCHKAFCNSVKVWCWSFWLGFKGWNMNPRRRHQHKFIYCCEPIYWCMRLLELILMYPVRGGADNTKKQYWNIFLK